MRLTWCRFLVSTPRKKSHKKTSLERRCWIDTQMFQVLFLDTFPLPPQITSIFQQVISCSVIRKTIKAHFLTILHHTSPWEILPISTASAIHLAGLSNDSSSVHVDCLAKYTDDTRSATWYWRAQQLSLSAHTTLHLIASYIHQSSEGLKFKYPRDLYICQI